MTNFMKLGYELANTEEDKKVHFHIALQPKDPNSTYVRHCVTIKPPPNAISWADEQKVE